MRKEPWWRLKPLAEMNPQEWESLCDGCGKCCLVKLDDPDTGQTLYTDVACRLLDGETCRCKHYSARRKIVKDCVVLTPETVGSLDFLPDTCAYRLLAEGRDLYWWHPLVSGNRESVHLAGVSVRHRSISETEVADEDLEDHIVDWAT